MKKSLPLSFLMLVIGGLAFASNSHASFIDVPPSHPYYEAIRYLEQQGAVEGYGDGTFLPDQEVNRVEALKIILKGSSIEPDTMPTEPPFKDVSTDAWYAKYVHQAKELGIIKGDDLTGLFRPGDIGNEAETLKVLLEANQREVDSVSNAPYLNVPADAWFAPYYAYAKSLSLLTPQEVQPSKPMTRGMLANLMYQLTQKPEGYQEGEASYYGLNLHGNGTASGEVFDAYALTAAHPSLPFGTMVKVTNLANNKEVIVKINDRGPYADGRIIDLSQAAFEHIAPLSQGVAQVSVIPLDALNPVSGELNCEKQDSLNYIAKNAFEGIQLDTDLQNRFLLNEVPLLSGATKATNDTGGITVFLVDEDEKQYHFYTQTDSSGHFDVAMHFPRPGKYQFGIVPSTSGESVSQEIWVLDPRCLEAYEEVNSTLLPPSEISLRVKEGDFQISWHDEANYNLYKVSLSQGGDYKIYLVDDLNQFTPNYEDFFGWQADLVNIEVQGAVVEQGSILEAEAINWSPPIKTTAQVELHREYVFNEKEAELLSVPPLIQAGQELSIKLNPKTNVNEKGLIILPSGQVEEALLSSDQNAMVSPSGIRVFPLSTNQIEFNFTPQTKETHVFEINNEEGQAVLNLPIYPENVYPLLPNPIDLEGSKQANLSLNMSQAQDQMLHLINKDRHDHNIQDLVLDTDLSALAQMKANDMAEKNYISHWDLNELTVNEYRKDFGIIPYVSENIAKETSPTLAQYGLMSSAAHRMNILNEEWKRVGFGLAKSADGDYIFVQIFSSDPIDFSNVEGLRYEILDAINQSKNTPLTMQSDLNSIAQNWSKKMVEDDFFGLTDLNNSKLVDMIRSKGYKAALGTYLVGNTSFQDALEQIQAHDQLKESLWKDIGIGIGQDSRGVIKITLVYTE